MASSMKTQFSGFFSQLLVVCLLAVFVAIAVLAMYSTSGVNGELEWIGMTVKPLEADTAAALGIPSNVGGVIVDEVEGLAARAGIRPGDVVQGINGEPVGDMAGFSELAGNVDLSKGGAQLVVNRRGIQMPILVYPSAAVIQGRGPTTPGGITQVPAALDRRWLGIDAETLARGEGRELGVPAGVAGVLIDGVTRGSQAQQAGLINNDVIVSVNGQRVDSTVGLWNTLAGLNGGDPVEFGVYRNGQLMSVALPTASGTLAGGFPGRMGGQGLGPGGTLACPNCGTKVTHQRGVPCYTVPCPSCGTQMVRAQ